MNSPLTDKQKRYIDDHIGSDSLRSIARHLQVDVQQVRAYVNDSVLKTKNPTRKIFFYLILLFIPVFFLVGAEIVLRLFHYGDTYSLVLTSGDGARKYYQINRRVAQRYFSGNEVVVPDAKSQMFEYTKSPNTFRIFCLGGSTTAGWPFQFNATFPDFLQDRLSLLFPHKNFEVINVGISAINSFSVLDFAEELVKYDPDLFLIYMGHNEFYGALGVASTQSLGSNRAFIKLYLKLERFRFFQLLRSVVFKIKSVFRQKSASGSARSLMEMMAGDKLIAYQSQKYNLAKKYFRQNLQDILQTIKKNNVPVIVGTLVSNVRDHEPFESLFSPGFDNKAAWNDLYTRGLGLESKADFAGAVELYLQAAELDSMPAKLYFRLGRCYEALGQYAQALQTYRKARDLDALRFRASTEFNDVIQSVCRQEGVAVAKVDSLFRAHSAHSLIGNNLILEHLHPNVKGYFLISDAFCRTMAAADVLKPKDQWPWQNDRSQEELINLAYITDLDLEIANQRIMFLTSRWPFKEQKRVRENSNDELDRLIAETVTALFRHEISWNEAHYRIGQYLTRQGRYQEAEREYRAVIKVTPTNFYPYIYLGNLLLAQNKWQEAERVYKNALLLSPSLPYAYAKLGVLYMSQNNAEKAMTVLKEAVSLGQRTKDFSGKELGRAQYLLAVAYAQMNDFIKAKAYALAAQKLLPNDPRIRQLIVKLNAVGTK